MSRNQIRLEFESTTPFGGGKSFGKTGPYEWLHGMVSFAIDPNEKDLPFVCDLEFAPRNADGLVEFKAVIDLVKPVDMSKSNRKLLFDFSNRGGRGAFTRLNDGGGDYTKAGAAGNGFLNKEGYTVVTAGWQGDLVYTGSNVVAFVPEARHNGQPLRGKVRQEFISDRKGVLSMPVSGAANIQCYPVLDRATATLTLREKEADPRVPVPASEWELAKAKDDRRQDRTQAVQRRSLRQRRFQDGMDLRADLRHRRVARDGAGLPRLARSGFFLALRQQRCHRRGQSARRRHRQSLRLRRVACRPGGARVRLRGLEPRRRRTPGFRRGADSYRHRPLVFQYALRPDRPLSAPA